MRKTVRGCVLAGLGVLVWLAPAAAEDVPARVKLARDLARAHAAAPGGKDWVARNLGKAGELMIPVLSRCVPDVADGELTAFSVYLRLSQKGKVLEVVSEIDAELGRCLTRQSRELQLLEAPREDFWVQVNLATML